MPASPRDREGQRDDGRCDGSHDVRGSTGVGSSCQSSTSYPSGSSKNTYGSPGQNSPRRSTRPPACSTASTATSMSPEIGRASCRERVEMVEWGGDREM